MAQNDSVARPYAQAVFDLAREAGQLEAWSALLADASAAIHSEELARLLERPGADHQAIAAALAELCAKDPEAAPVADSDYGRNFFRLLGDNRRFGALPAIAETFEQLKAEVENTVDVVLTTATPVDETQQAGLVDALRRRFGREVRLRVVQDDNLIGGARLRADDHVIDGTVRTRLAKLASALVH